MMVLAQNSSVSNRSNASRSPPPPVTTPWFSRTTQLKPSANAPAMWRPSASLPGRA